MSGSAGLATVATNGSDTSDFNALSFVVEKIIGRKATATLVQVIACTNTGGLSPIGFVDVHPLVNQVDGSGKAVPHGTVFNLRYLRVQAGTNAVIMDPTPNDIGVAWFASSDISNVKVTRKQANPGSKRRFSMADGIYGMTVISASGGPPTQYIQFNSTGINIVSPTQVSLSCAGHSVLINSTGVVIDGKVFLAHEHTNSGGSGIGGPVA